MHTPGPWTYDGGMVSAGKWDHVCILLVSQNTRLDPVKTLANGLLIAAAPQLLEALINLVSFHDYGYLDMGIGTETPDGTAWLQARAAIATAKGEV